MKFTKKNIEDAVKENIISFEQSEKFIGFLNKQPNTESKFDFTHVLYYMGGFIAIGAMTFFMNLGWESFGGAGVFFIALCYAAVALILTNIFKSKGLDVPAGICGTFIIALTPLAVYGLQHTLGVWPDENVYREYDRFINLHWLYIELSTLAVGCIIAWKYKYPFLIMPIAVTFWYLTIDISVVMGGNDYNLELSKLASMYSGLLMIAIAFWIDIKFHHKADYSFWLYFFGVTAFWCGMVMSLQNSDSEMYKYTFIINLFMVFIGVLIVRRVFVIFGTIGCFSYIGYLAFEIFEDSLLFPVALTVLGFFVIYLGVVWQRNEVVITSKARGYLPKIMREFLESKYF